MRRLLLSLAVSWSLGALAAEEPAAPTAPAAPVAAEAEDPAVDAALFDKKGKLNRATYQRYALDWRPAAIDQRFGPDAKALAAEKKKDKKEDKKVEKKDDAKDDKPAKPRSGKTKPGDDAPPEIWQPPEHFFQAGRNGGGFKWTIGEAPSNDPGDYSSTHAQVFYSPDQKGDPGVDRIGILDMGHMVFAARPEPTWWGGSHPEPAVTTQAWLQQTGNQLGAPVAMARAYGSWCNNGLMVFSSGLVGAAGTCTSQSTYVSLMLPPGKVPTGISLTNRNEFAFISVWDVKELKGQVAVIALESMHTEGLMALYEFHQPHPGLFNVGGFRTMKLLGFIDLPFATPTSICAVGNRQSCWLTQGGKNSQPVDFDLVKQEVRDGFYKGENADTYQTAGFAVVASRYEHKVCFIDLQPLFAFYREMYFTTSENYQRTRDQGPGPKQWPFTFEGDPRCKPVVVKTAKVPSPTAVNASLFGDEQSRAYVATEDGRLTIWRVGGLATEAPADPGQIGPVGAIEIGKNPVCLAYNKSQGWGGPDTLRNEVVAVCRGTAELVWVRITGDSGTVVRRLQDPKRLIDPVWAEVADTHGTESHVITVTDFKGRQVINYRFGPVIFHTNKGKRFDMGPDGKAEFECGGVMPFPGFPYLVCGTNVN